MIPWNSARHAVGRLVVPLSERSRRILGQLLQADKPLSISEIGLQLHLTRAQVRYCLGDLGPWLRERGIKLNKTPRIGVSIAAPPVARRRLLGEIRNTQATELFLHKDERMQLLLLRLLTATAPLSVSEFARHMGVSRSSIFRDLAAARAWLRQRGLRLSVRRSRGGTVTGDERCWRDALVELLLTNLTPSALISACLRPGTTQETTWADGSAFLYEALGFLGKLNLAQAEQCVSTLEGYWGIVLLDQAHIQLVLCTSLALQAMQAGRALAGGPPAPNAAEIAHLLAPIVKPGLPDTECAYLADRMAQAVTAGLVLREQGASTKDKARRSAAELADHLTKEAAKYLHARLFHDQELANCLALELARERCEKPSALPLSEESPFITRPSANPLYGFTLRILCPILQRHGYPPSEPLLAAIAMHLETALERLGRTYARRRVWVVCGAGVATARNLISRLNLHLPQLEIIGLASALEVAREPAMVAGADAIISTIPLHWVTGVPVLQVSPLLSTQDVAMLKTALVLDTPPPPMEAKPSPTGSPSVLEILPRRSIRTDVLATGWENVVDQAGALLLAAEAVWPSYVEAMKDMIRLYGPYVVVAPGAALLHAGPEMGGKRLAMSLVTLHQPVAFGHETNDPVHVALAFSSLDHSTHVRAIGEAMTLLSNQEGLRRIRRARTAEEILQLIAQFA